MKDKKKQLKKKAKNLLREADKLTKRARKLKERARKLKEKADNKTSREDRGLVIYKGELIKKGSSKDKEKVDKRSKKRGKKAELTKKLYAIAKIMFLKRYNKLNTKQRLTVDSEFKKYKDLPRSKIEKIFLEKNFIVHLKKLQPVTSEQLVKQFGNTVLYILMKVEREGIAKYVDDKWMLS